MVTNNTCKQLGETKDDICMEIIADFVSRRQTSAFSITEVLGCAYSTQWDGTGTWKTVFHFLCYPPHWRFSIWRVMTAIRVSYRVDFLSLPLSPSLSLSPENIIATQLREKAPLPLNDQLHPVSLSSEGFKTCFFTGLFDSLFGITGIVACPQLVFNCNILLC